MRSGTLSHHRSVARIKAITPYNRISTLASKRVRALERLGTGRIRSLSHPRCMGRRHVRPQTRYPNSVLSRESTLFLLELTDHEPDRYSITLMTGTSSSNLSNEEVKISKVKADLLALGLAEAKTPFGHTVRTYNAERTICDIVRKRRFVEAHDLQGALKAYVRSKGRDTPLPMRYARAFSVETVLNRYLEVLI